MGLALRRLLQQWKPLQMFFEEECKKDIKAVLILGINTVKGKSEEEKKRSSIRTRVHDFLKRSTAKLYALFLSFAMESFDILNQELQTDAAKIHVVKRSLEQFYRKLLISFVKPSALSSGTLLAVDFTAKYNMKDSKDILIGTATKQHISGLRDKVAEQFMKDVISFYQAACTYLKAKVFPVGEPLWKHAQVADIKLKETALFSSLDYFMERFPCLLPHEVGEDESPQEALTRAKDQLQAEFTDYQSWEVPSHLMTEEKVATEQLWAQITKVKDCNEAMRFQVLPRVMLGILLLPVSNAACERVFSVARRNRTVFRSSMGKDTTEALLVLKSKGGACFENTFADNMMVAGYILSVYTQMQEEQRQVTPGNTPVKRRNASQTQRVLDATVTPSVVTFSQDLVQGEMAQQLFALTQKIQKKLSGNRSNSNHLSAEFPRLPGSHLPLSNPALEFVKSVCQRNARSFTRTTSEEMRAFLAIHLYMGVIKLPSYRLYCSTREDLHQRSITKVMSKNRYEELVVNFHLNDSTQNPPRGHPDHNKLYKVMPIISHAKRTFPTLYKPHQNLAVDEAMIKFKGRCSFLQYVPAKPHKWGIKAWALCDSESYYMLDFDVYTGKDMQAPIQQTPLGQRVVETLVQPYYRQYHHVYFDNYFTSVPLVENLLRNETYSCGTIRTNRKGLPQEIKTVKFRQSGQMMKKQKGGMHVVAWCEKKRKVCVLSTANNIDNTEITRPGKRGQPAQTYPKPVAIQQYTDHFNAVDKNDQMRSYYGIANKARKFWKYIFWFIVDVSMINAFVLYKEARGGPRPKPMTHLEFHLEVARELVRNYTSRKRQASFPASSPLAPKEPRPRHEISNIKTKHGKRLCVVLSLDTNISLQVTKLRRDLLKLIGVGEFAAEATFVDPCLSYVLPEVICKSCNHIRDLDLCRDPYLSQDGSGSWRCVQCDVAYDMEEIEHSMVAAVHRKSMAFVLQDVKCLKCNMVKENNMRRYCTCAGEYSNTFTPGDLGQQLHTFLSIARHYQMTQLEETVDWIVQMNPGMAQT
ncbi:hypothetical protein ACOMHN_032656 [Nucella lapillus]